LARFRNVAGAACFVATAALCTDFEGVRTHAYHDTLAHGLPTVCAGETEGVKMTDVYTPVECKEMLAKKLPRYWNEINLCIDVPISDNEKIAYIDFAYNVGSGAFCHSSLLKQLNEHHHIDACEGLMAWDVASGEHRPGLARRRAAEMELCMRPDVVKQTHIPLPVPAPHKVVCHGWWFWKVCK
jgi:lysozyme